MDSDTAKASQNLKKGALARITKSAGFVMVPTWNALKVPYRKLQGKKGALLDAAKSAGFMTPSLDILKKSCSKLVIIFKTAANQSAAFLPPVPDLKRIYLKTLARSRRAITNQLVNFTPPLMEAVNHNEQVERILAKIASKYFPHGAKDFPFIKTKIKGRTAVKPRWKIDPYAAPQAYADAIGDPMKEPAKTISVRYRDQDEPVKLTLCKPMHDEIRGFRGAVYRDKEGHAIVFFSGMNLENGNGRHGLDAIVQMRFMNDEAVNLQISPAQRLYLWALRHSSSVEIVGYSLGSALANHMSAKMRAKTTIFAATGLPTQTPCGRPHYTQEELDNITENTVALKLDHDPFTGVLGKIRTKFIYPLSSPPLAFLKTYHEPGTPEAIIYHDQTTYICAAKNPLPSWEKCRKPQPDTQYVYPAKAYQELLEQRHKHDVQTAGLE